MTEVIEYTDLNIELYKPRDVFLDFHDRTQRWAVIIAHRRAGKTVACRRFVLNRSVQRCSKWRGLLRKAQEK